MLLIALICASVFLLPTSAAPVAESSNEPKWIKTQDEDPYASVLDEIIGNNAGGYCSICQKQLEQWKIIPRCCSNHQYHSDCYKKWAAEMRIVDGLAQEKEEEKEDRCPVCENSLEPTMETAIILDHLEGLPEIAAHDDCPICENSLATQGTEAPIVSTICGHLFHEQCIRKWTGRERVRGGRKNRIYCPTCRYLLVD